MRRSLLLTIAAATLTLSALAFACAPPAEEEQGSGAGAATVGKSGDWNLKCTSGPNKGMKKVFADEPTHQQKMDLCPNGIAKATEKATSADGDTVWTIRCDVDKGTNGKAKKADLDHEPSVAELIATCPGDYADAGGYTADAGAIELDSGSD